jgi:hypothetical protein
MLFASLVAPSTLWQTDILPKLYWFWNLAVMVVGDAGIVPNTIWQTILPPCLLHA